jgi:hypothetical protein
LRGKGIGGGDLYVVLEVAMPRAGDDAERERVAKELDALYDHDVRAELRRRAS